MRQVAVEIGRGAARRGGQEHQTNRKRRSQTKGLGQEETHQWQQQQLASQADQHWFREFHHPGKIRQGQRQTQAKHDDAQSNGQEQSQ